MRDNALLLLISAGKRHPTPEAGDVPRRPARGIGVLLARQPRVGPCHGAARSVSVGSPASEGPIDQIQADPRVIEVHLGR
jgi:hypothetical protein